MDNSGESRQIVSKALQEALHTDDAAEAQGNVVTRWVVVAESMGLDGQRWLSRVSSDAAGQGLTAWDTKGFLYEALDESGWND